MKNPSLDKGKKPWVKKVATTHPSAKRKRGDSQLGSPSVEELWVQLGLRLKELGEVGPYVADQLNGGSPSRIARLEEKVTEGEKRARELRSVIMRQTDELAKLTKIVGTVGAENLHLKKENTRLMDEVSQLKEVLELKERELLGWARVWVEENKTEVAWVLTSTPEATMESF
ncbi:unnamed protein product [Cuscuta campestris]|uniref:Uncharacterized protein n=1 Tax=Cuscuta campestris TaxID=132261 RepID=A0A484LQ58_9ASTE|nr:unnamed protein product [Cuscuta campestris]VFQ78663.1 unnamed protein product [Cuscuta campestris]